jgi:hypothetical protein
MLRYSTITARCYRANPHTLCECMLCCRLVYCVCSAGVDDAVKLWLALLARLQCMDAATRKVGTHVEYESRRWMSAIGVSLNVAGVSEAMISKVITASSGSSSTSGSSSDSSSSAVQQLADAALLQLYSWLQRQSAAGAFKLAGDAPRRVAFKVSL